MVCGPYFHLKRHCLDLHFHHISFSESDFACVSLLHWTHLCNARYSHLKIFNSVTSANSYCSPVRQHVPLSRIRTWTYLGEGSIIQCRSNMFHKMAIPLYSLLILHRYPLLRSRKKLCEARFPSCSLPTLPQGISGLK